MQTQILQSQTGMKKKHVLNSIWEPQMELYGLWAFKQFKLQKTLLGLN